ncbi:endonuclease/exonuclease/phosphatase family protein [Mucisphaera calidilacus]|uniref:Endonuclease/exonuclease/phosphatase domain-containing protein n=1 Tax=Mucisphaera calidilacus TaxID=2527982 RepID=A0A518BUV5_9BACT|nr:endonuclease/exonuclease/phosphatase family protein [Mucisphaera calidilacus]QDU70749.1 hypothetical protein Pan265_05840 [Mucisphaera calidilacus]
MGKLMRFTVVCVVLSVASWASAQPVPGPAGVVSGEGERPHFRVATFNASLSREPSGQMLDDLRTGKDPGARRAAEILQRVRPDVVLINEFDRDRRGEALRIFMEFYLHRPQSGQEPIQYPYSYAPEVNTGRLAEVDINGDGKRTLPQDAYGYGRFPGHYGFVVLSRHELRITHARTFQNFLWKDMPGALLPDDASTEAPGDYYSEEVQEHFRLSSKTHVDLPVWIHGRIVHLLVSHPTPPVFDGREDRNGRRNHDEIRFWSDYLSFQESGYIRDDAGRRGGLADGTNFVILGDMNADPFDGDSTQGAVNQLLKHPRVNTSVTPSSRGAELDAEREGRANERHRGEARYDTADFGGPGNLRVDYVLPSKAMKIRRAGVFWPAPLHPLEDLIETSDHRLVWMDLAFTR